MHSANLISLMRSTAFEIGLNTLFETKFDRF